jgi:hypothetical protein
LLVVLLMGGLGGCLLLKTSLQEQAFELSSLRAEAERLGDHEAFLRAGLALRTTPAELARAAAGLGMVANPYGAYLILPGGQVQGVTRPVNGSELTAMAPPVEPPTPDPTAPAVDPAAPDGSAAQTDPDRTAQGADPDPAAAGQGEVAGAGGGTTALTSDQTEAQALSSGPTDPTETG